MLRRLVLALLAFVVAAGAAVWHWRDSVLLPLPGMIDRWRDPIGPTKDVAWQSGAAGKPAGERPPNIVVIVADDLGYNDLTFAGGGVANGAVPTPRIDSIARITVTLWVGERPTGERRVWHLELNDELPPASGIEGAQQRLINLGYLSAGAPSGELDAATRAAVLAFQADHELDPSGDPGDIADRLDQVHSG